MSFCSVFTTWGVGVSVLYHFSLWGIYGFGFCICFYGVGGERAERGVMEWIISLSAYSRRSFIGLWARLVGEGGGCRYDWNVEEFRRGISR